MAVGLMFVGATTDIVPEETLPIYSNEKHVECLAMNMYHEARNQGTAGRLAVSAVVMNRVNDKRFPNTVCEVVLQSQMKKSWKTGLPIPIRNRCQFSWYCDGKSDIPTDSKTWDQSMLLAERVLDNFYPDITEGALWYHSDAVKPYWSKQLNRTVTIDNHLFYN